MTGALLADGVLVSSAKPEDTTLFVDDTLWGYISQFQDCYLVIGGIEPIKVLGSVAPNALLVQRRIETDNRNTWPVGTRVRYQLTVSEIVESTPGAAPFEITTTGFVNYSEGMLSYYRMTMGAFGGISVDGDYTTGVWRIEDISANSGCKCGPPPEIPPQYQKLRIIGSGAYRILSDGSYRRYG
jgi:hypothetical protein